MKHGVVGEGSDKQVGVGVLLVYSKAEASINECLHLDWVSSYRKEGLNLRNQRLPEWTQGMVKRIKAKEESKGTP